MTKKAKKVKTLKIAFFFCIIVFSLILLSFVVKIAIIVAGSHFDGSHQFVLQAVVSQSKSDIVVFNPQQHVIHTVVLVGDQASEDALRTLAIPVDVKVSVSSALDSYTGKSFVTHTLFATMWHRKELNMLDALRLWWVAQTVSSNDIDTKVVDLGQNNTPDSLLSTFLTDQSIFSDSLNIAVVNASGVSGVGNNVAKVLSHIGGNVISITTATKDQPTSTIVYTGKKTYTLSRMSDIFGIMPTLSTHEHIADITITIGEDKGISLSSI